MSTVPDSEQSKHRDPNGQMRPPSWGASAAEPGEMDDALTQAGEGLLASGAEKNLRLMCGEGGGRGELDALMGVPENPGQKKR